MAPGEKVTWTWAGAPHSSTGDATSGPEVWDSGVLAVGAIFSHTFSTPGTYPYHCSVHSFAGGTFMNAVVQVVPPPTLTPTPTSTATSTSPPTATATPAATPVPTPVPVGGAAVPDLGRQGRLIFAAGLAIAALLALLARKR